MPMIGLEKYKEIGLIWVFGCGNMSLESKASQINMTLAAMNRSQGAERMASLSLCCPTPFGERRKKVAGGQ